MTEYDIPAHLNEGLEATMMCATQTQAVYAALAGGIAPLLAIAIQTIQSQQARIDELMLEYCPEEMTAEQRANWAKHQQPTTLPS